MITTGHHPCSIVDMAHPSDAEHSTGLAAQGEYSLTPNQTRRGYTTRSSHRGAFAISNSASIGRRAILCTKCIQPIVYTAKRIYCPMAYWRKTAIFTLVPEVVNLWNDVATAARASSEGSVHTSSRGSPCAWTAVTILALEDHRSPTTSPSWEERSMAD